MKHTLDFNIVWRDAIALLQAHREALIAIAGLLLFLPSWITLVFAPSPDFSNAKTMNAMLVIQQSYVSENWMVLLPMGLVSLFGTAFVTVLLTRTDLERVGDAFPVALRLLPVFVVLQFVTGIFVAASLFVLIIPGLYVLARLLPTMALLSSRHKPGLIGSIGQSWQLTKGVGFKVLGFVMIIVIVGFIMIVVGQIVAGLILKMVTGGTILTFVEAAISAVLGAAFNVVVLAASVAVYRHLHVQTFKS